MLVVDPSLTRLRAKEPAPAPQDLPVDALMGRLTQVASGPQGGGSTVAATLVQRAQRRKEPTAWVQWQGGSLYPPDLHAQGILLEALLVVHVGDAYKTHPRLRAAELLLRSGGFGLVVVDLTAGQVPQGLAWQHRLQHWAREHHSAVVLMTSTTQDAAPSLGALISLQLVPERTLGADGLFEQQCGIGKNKMGGAMQPWRWQASGPPGLR
jgi:recombination protein RecA